MAWGVRAAVARRAVDLGERTASSPFPPAAGPAGATGLAELACLQGVLPAPVLAEAEDRAARVGVGADRVLVAKGALREEDYLRALGAHLGIAFEPLDRVSRRHCPFDDARLLEAATAGLLPLTENGETAIVVAPRGTAARGLANLIRDDPSAARRFRLTTAERLNRFILRNAGSAAVGAAERLKRQTPQLSAAPPLRRLALAPLALLGFLLGGILLAPAATMQAVGLILAGLFLAWLVLRAATAFVAPVAGATSALPDSDLPVYSVIAALYREARSADGLLCAIERLDYPAEKLDVILALEADDRETRRAIAARRHRIPISVVTVPKAGPRTKPKALNVALSFARGTFTVIYDAEDRPERDQLHVALGAFEEGGAALGCVQGRLCIDNTEDGWLARLFTTEYAGQFDVFLPALSALRLPLPLGGSSNHFRTETLRKVGGWDAYNVTEDADLGVRLARFGYRAATIASTTYEEAPARFGPWLRQRTRWFKGWMQTWLVHMRRPRRLLRELGLRGFVAFQLVVGGNVLAALVHPLFLLLLLRALTEPSAAADSLPLNALAALYGVTAAAGYLVSAALGFIGLKRRGLIGNAWALLLMPAHWLLLSLASWRALYQLIAAPYAWEKTEHGLARHSRRHAELARVLLELERHLRRLKAN